MEGGCRREGPPSSLVNRVRMASMASESMAAPRCSAEYLPRPIGGVALVPMYMQEGLWSRDEVIGTRPAGFHRVVGAAFM